MGAWIETLMRSHGSTMPLCRILHGCVDWNCQCTCSDSNIFLSHPTWVRGLKHTIFKIMIIVVHVASYMGAWIETYNDKVTTMSVVGRILHGCVDWNKESISYTGVNIVASYMGAWIETLLWVLFNINNLSRILHGCVDWNYNSHSTLFHSCRSHPTWVRGLKRRGTRTRPHRNCRILHGCVDCNIAVTKL